MVSTPDEQVAPCVVACVTNEFVCEWVKADLGCKALEWLLSLGRHYKSTVHLAFITI